MLILLLLGYDASGPVGCWIGIVWYSGRPFGSVSRHLDGWGFRYLDSYAYQCCGIRTAFVTGMSSIDLATSSKQHKEQDESQRIFASLPSAIQHFEWRASDFGCRYLLHGRKFGTLVEYHGPFAFQGGGRTSVAGLYLSQCRHGFYCGTSPGIWFCVSTDSLRWYHRRCLCVCATAATHNGSHKMKRNLHVGHYGVRVNVLMMMF
mmetsp:Transcript_27831/g.58261  ORF Transcript_27831/g.58261 Transcript_27831/m.58261 type:complete len:205 (+) Transcript_27831:375-989(+)